jgi:hypothetical protein
VYVNSIEVYLLILFFRGDSILKMEAEYSAETSAVQRILHSLSTQEQGQDRH